VFRDAKPYTDCVLLIVAQHYCWQREYMRHLQLDRAFGERACCTGKAGATGLDLIEHEGERLAAFAYGGKHRSVASTSAGLGRVGIRHKSAAAMAAVQASLQPPAVSTIVKVIPRCASACTR